MKLPFLVFLALLLPGSLRAAQPSLTVDDISPTGTVSPRLYGLMTEEINFSYDGGLYAELVRNRAFLNNRNAPDNWFSQGDGQANVKLSLDSATPLNAKIPVSLRMDITGATGGRPVGAANEGYWGIPIYPKTTYKASLYAKAAAGGPKTLTVALISPDGLTVYAKAEVATIGPEWTKYEATLATGEVTPTSKARLLVGADSAGTVWLSMVSLFPPTWNDRPNGLRRDLMQMLVDLKPKFLRFPGGNYLEGNTIAERFQWKNTLGPIEQRPGHPSPWGYRSTDGMGLLEFLLWCEDLGAEPVLGVYAGYSLNGSYVPAGPQLDVYVQEALEEIEYITGDITTKWGAQRAADGHPAPFTLNYVEIGNEDFFDKSLSYDGRFAQFHDAIKAKYPKIKLISSVGNEQPASLRVKSRVPDVLDEHYYRSTDEFVATAAQFDSYPRSGPEIFVGEWAAHEDARIRPWDGQAKTLAPTPPMKAALGDAVWMTAMERNSDLISMHCYAPLLVNVNPGAWQWRPDLIGYDALRCFGSPSYHAQALFSRNVGDELLKTSTSAAVSKASATRDSSSGRVYLKLVNPSATTESIQITLKSGALYLDTASVVTLSASPEKGNSLETPLAVAPVASLLKGVSSSFTYAVAGNSITLLTIDRIAPPQFTVQPESATVAPGGSITLSATVRDAVTLQWKKNGESLPGANGPELKLGPLVPSDGGDYTLVAANKGGSTTSMTARLLVATPENGRLMNLSVRSLAGTGDQTLTAGFALSGEGSRMLLLRGIGPSLAQFGVSDVLADPGLQLLSGGAVLASNADWGGTEELLSLYSKLGAFALAKDSRDAALQIAPPTGPCTAQVFGYNSSQGVALIEVYDAGGSPDLPRLVNLSARSLVAQGDNVLIAGFSISGNVPKRLLLRGVGPGLQAFAVKGALEDPLLQLFDAARARIAENDNWAAAPSDPARVTIACDQVGAFHLDEGSRDAALLVTLPPGNYTAQVSGQNASTGVALVEIYELP